LSAYVDKRNKTYLGNYCRNNQYSACLCVGLSSRERATETELELLELEEAEEETMRRLEQDENCDEKRRELSLRVTCNFPVSVGDGQKMLLFLVTVQSRNSYSLRYINFYSYSYSLPTESTSRNIMDYISRDSISQRSFARRGHFPGSERRSSRLVSARAAFTD